MREILLGTNRLLDPEGGPLTCRYHIVVHTLPPPLACESYGLHIIRLETGEEAAVPDLTVQWARIEPLAAAILRGCVTPCALREVVEDWL